MTTPANHPGFTQPAEQSKARPIFTARFGFAGSPFTAPADIPLLLAAELAGLPASSLPSSCRNGTCRTCICQLLEGDVAYRIAWPGLSAEEKAVGYVLACVAYPLSNLVLQLAA